MPLGKFTDLDKYSDVIIKATSEEEAATLVPTWGFTPTLRALGSMIDAGALCFDNGNPVSKAAMQGMINVLNYSPRGDILPSVWRQSSGEGLRYSAAVPLILSAFKEYRNVRYSDWDWTDLNRKYLLDFDFFELSEHFGCRMSWDVEQLLEFREVGRTIATGVKAGQKKDIISTTTLSKIDDPDFKALPRLAKLLLCQVWVYHPTIRHKLMITDLMHLDDFSPPLVQDEPLNQLESIWNV